MIARLAGVLWLTATASQAADLNLALPPDARAVVSAASEMGIQRFPTGPFHAGELPHDRIEGTRHTEVFQVEGSLNPAETAAAMARQLTANSFDPVFSCDAVDCGGFDFRFALQVVPEPDMYVDLGNYHFAAFRHATSGATATLLISATAETGYLQVDSIWPGAARVPLEPPKASGPTTRAPADGNIEETLAAHGSAVLEDLTFTTGSSELDGTEFTSVRALAGYLSKYPDRSITLVGHTDSAGSLDANIRLSERRAASVRRLLLDTYGVSANRITARGVGFLSPRTTNATEDGRTLNRRVEVVLNEP